MKNKRIGKQEVSWGVAGGGFLLGCCVVVRKPAVLLCCVISMRLLNSVETDGCPRLCKSQVDFSG